MTAVVARRRAKKERRRKAPPGVSCELILAQLAGQRQHAAAEQQQGRRFGHRAAAVELADLIRLDAHSLTVTVERENGEGDRAGEAEECTRGIAIDESDEHAVSVQVDSNAGATGAVKVPQPSERRGRSSQSKGCKVAGIDPIVPDWRARKAQQPLLMAPPPVWELKVMPLGRPDEKS